MTEDEVQTLVAALHARWPDVEFRAEPFDCRTRLGVAVKAKSGATFALATPAEMDWRALSMPEWLHRFSEALAPRLK